MATVGGALTGEPRELGRQIVGAHGAELGESLIGGQRAGEVPYLALHAPEPHQRARPHAWVVIAGQRSISHNGTRGVTAEFDRFQRREPVGDAGRLNGHRDEGQSAGRVHFDAIGPRPDDDRAVDRGDGRRRIGDPATQALAGFRQLFADAGGDRVGDALGLVARALFVDRALLIEQPPSRPPERRGDDDGRRHERREQ